MTHLVRLSQRSWLALALVVVAALAAGCQEPCVALAERICSCEPDEIARRACRDNRIDTQQGRVPTEAEQEVCVQALDTCTCEALEENRTELCGFTREQAPSDGGA